jgi:hypothetical protein
VHVTNILKHCMKHLFQSFIASLLLFLITLCAVQAQTTCPADRSACANEAPFALSGASPAGGTFSGPGVSGGMFSPALAGTGAKTITYTYQDGGNTSTCTFIITVNPAAEALAVLGVIPACVNDGPALPEQYGTITSFHTTPAEPISVSWTGAGITGNSVTGYQFSPAIAGAGLHNIYATATTSHGCTSGPFASIIAIDGAPAVSCPGDMTSSLAATAFALSGAKNLTVRGLPSASGNSTTDAGGIYTGPAVNSATASFNPSAAGEGVHQITYTVDNGCGPAASCTFNVQVVAAVPVCPADRSVCQNEPAFALTGASPAGGTYSGPGVSGGMFTPELAGTGAKTITYTYQDGGNTSTCTFVITVNAAPERMEVLGLIGVCVDESANLPEYFGTIKSFSTTPSEPISVTWTGAGITGNSVLGYQFTPAIVGTGFHTIYATATTSHGCTSGPFTSEIAVGGAPAVSCPGDTTVSVLDNAFTLTGAKNLTISGMPSSSGNPVTDVGGFYAGTGVSSTTAVFDPSVAGEGVHRITYTVGDGCGPAASCTFNVKTSPMPVKLVSFAADKKENKILLSWKTSEETGFDRFEIEKSENPKKGFVKIGRVAGRGATHAYSFLDNSAIVPGAPVYYRLKMVDLDGTYAYSKIVREAVDGAKVTTVYPNPVSGELSVISQSYLVEIQLINLKGVTVIAQKPERSKTNILDVSRLPVGTYIVRTKDIDGQIYKSKVAIQR